MDTPEDGSWLELFVGRPCVTPPRSGEHQYAMGHLCMEVDDGLRAAGRRDLCVIPAVGVVISRAWRTGFIPDMVVVNRTPAVLSYPEVEDVLLAGEVWSPDDRPDQREAKAAAYAAARVPFLWTVEQQGETHELTAHRLDRDRYVVAQTVRNPGPTTITAAPVPVTVDLADLVF